MILIIDKKLTEVSQSFDKIIKLCPKYIEANYLVHQDIYALDQGVTGVFGVLDLLNEFDKQI